MQWQEAYKNMETHLEEMIREDVKAQYARSLAEQEDRTPSERVMSFGSTGSDVQIPPENVPATKLRSQSRGRSPVQTDNVRDHPVDLG